MTIDQKYRGFFENIHAKGEKQGEPQITCCFDCVSSRLLVWSHPMGFGEKDYRSLDVIDLEWKESDRKKQTNQKIARIYCLNLRLFVPQAEHLVECRFFMTPAQYEQKKKREPSGGRSGS